MLAISGCTRPNPAFGDTEPSTSTEPDDGETRADDGETRADDGETEEGNVDTTAAEPSDTTGEDVSCPPDPFAPIHIVVTEADGTVVDPSDMCDAVIQRTDGAFLYEEGLVRHQICEACECAALEGLTLDFEDTLVLPDELPECGTLVIWEGPAPEGGCRWDGFAILAQHETVIPTYVAVNSRTLPEDPFGPVQIDLDQEALCEEIDSECTEHPPGRYTLGFNPDASVAVDDEPEPVVGIGSFAEVSFTVDNRMASVDLDCREHVAWTALQAENG